MKQTNPILPPWVRGLFGSEEERADFDWGGFWRQVAGEMATNVTFLALVGIMLIVAVLKLSGIYEGSDFDAPSRPTAEAQAAAERAAAEPTSVYSSPDNPWAKD